MHYLVSLFMLVICISSAQAKDYCITDDTWQDQCKSIAYQRMSQLKVLDRHLEIEELPKYIEDLRIMTSFFETKWTEKHMLMLCKAILATAEQESMFEFRVGGLGELGMFQFRISTIRLILKKYGIPIRYDDRSIVEAMLKPEIAVKMFILYFNMLYQYQGNTYRAWYKYNGTGPAAVRYANAISKKFYLVNRIKPQRCEE